MLAAESTSKTGDSEDLILRALAFWQNGRTDKAAGVADRLRQEKSQLARTWSAVFAELYASTLDATKLYRSCEVARKVYPQSAYVIFVRAFALEQLGEVDLAIAGFRRGSFARAALGAGSSASGKSTDHDRAILIGLCRVCGGTPSEPRIRGRLRCCSSFGIEDCRSECVRSRKLVITNGFNAGHAGEPGQGRVDSTTPAGSSSCGSREARWTAAGRRSQ